MQFVQRNQPDTAAPQELPELKHIRNVRLESGATAKDSHVVLEYDCCNGEARAITMPLLEAMIALKLLCAVQKQARFELPPEPFCKTFF